jgi:hypothetical protein
MQIVVQRAGWTSNCTGGSALLTRTLRGLEEFDRIAVRVFELDLLAIPF